MRVMASLDAYIRYHLRRPPLLSVACGSFEVLYLTTGKTSETKYEIASGSSRRRHFALWGGRVIRNCSCSYD